jgi:hypothetical protein
MIMCSPFATSEDYEQQDERCQCALGDCSLFDPRADYRYSSDNCRAIRNPNIVENLGRDKLKNPVENLVRHPRPHLADAL